jgi:hypothetical protein
MENYYLHIRINNVLNTKEKFINSIKNKLQKYRDDIFESIAGYEKGKQSEQEHCHIHLGVSTTQDISKYMSTLRNYLVYNICNNIKKRAGLVSVAKVRTDRQTNIKYVTKDEDIFFRNNIDDADLTRCKLHVYQPKKLLKKDRKVLNEVITLYKKDNLVFDSKYQEYEYLGNLIVRTKLSMDQKIDDHQLQRDITTVYLRIHEDRISQYVRNVVGRMYL